MSTLYVIEQGARIEKEYRRILITKEDQVLQRAPLARVSHVVLVGNVGVTTPAMHALLAQGVTLSLVNRSGRLLGHLQSPAPKNAQLRRTQYLIEEDGDFCLDFARAIVLGKLRNSLSMVRRIGRRRRSLDQISEEASLVLKQAQKEARKTSTLAELRGVEGWAARRYFAFLRTTLPPEFDFQRRVRRPPTDPFNALLSFGYTLLNQALMSALETVGLDPYIGFFHAEKYGRPALALDLVEEFRAPIVDSLALLLVNKRMITPQDFRRGEDGGMHLRSHGLRIFFREFADRLETRKFHPYGQRPFSYRKIFEIQARLVAKRLQGELPAYQPFNWR